MTLCQHQCNRQCTYMCSVSEAYFGIVIREVILFCKCKRYALCTVFMFVGNFRHVLYTTDIDCEQGV